MKWCQLCCFCHGNHYGIGLMWHGHLHFQCALPVIQLRCEKRNNASSVFLRSNCISVWLLMETTRPINVSTLITSSHYLLLIQACLLIIAAFFLQAVTCPAVDVSHIMLEAYKKFILVSLALHGKVRNPNWMVK